MANRFAFSAFLIAAFAILALAGRQATTSPTSVLVTNSTSQAVPVKPASGSAFAVAVANTPSVHAYITNALTAPVATTNAQDKSRYRQQFFFHLLDGQSSATGGFTVPAGKRLILDCVSAYSSSDNDGQYCSTADVEAYDNGSSTILGNIDFVLAGMPGYTTRSVLTQPVSFSAEPGETVYVSVERGSNNAGGANGTVSLYGHWVSVP